VDRLRKPVALADSAAVGNAEPRLLADDGADADAEMSRFMEFLDSVPDLIALGFLALGVGCLVLSDWWQKRTRF
jgi:hypothetical protein